MANDKIISADTHIVEPPDIYASRIDPKLRDEAPVMRKAKTEDGRDYDGWFYNGEQVATVGGRGPDRPALRGSQHHRLG